MTTQTQMLPVSWFLENLTSSVDHFDLAVPEGWAHMVAFKGNDHYFPELLEAIMADGFTVPVCVRPIFDEDKGVMVWQMGNGHHRLVAALLLCLDEIPAVWGNKSDFMMDEITEPEGSYFDEMSDEDKESWMSLLRTLPSGY